jgi:hypothetical protein
MGWEAILDLGSRAVSHAHIFPEWSKGFTVISSPGEKFPGQTVPKFENCLVQIRLEAVLY